jgi:arsenate reductase-like glutaredoxin family protein
MDVGGNNKSVGHGIDKATVEKMEKLLLEWQELLKVLQKEQKELHQEFLKISDAEKMKKILDKLKNIEE